MFKGFVDLEAVSESIFYTIFKIFFIFTGLTTQASSMNLLVLKLTSNYNEEQFNTKNNHSEFNLNENSDKISICSLRYLNCNIFKQKRYTKNRLPCLSPISQDSNNEFNIESGSILTRRLSLVGNKIFQVNSKSYNSTNKINKPIRLKRNSV